MSYTATIERKRRSKMYRGADSYVTENRFVGRAVRGTASLKEFDSNVNLGINVHLDEESVVTAGAVEGTLRDFVTVDIAAYHHDSNVLRNPEAILYMSEAQARALRDSLNALDI